MARYGLQCWPHKRLSPKSQNCDWLGSISRDIPGMEFLWFVTSCSILQFLQILGEPTKVCDKGDVRSGRKPPVINGHGFLAPASDASPILILVLEKSIIFCWLRGHLFLTPTIKANVETFPDSSRFQATSHQAEQNTKPRSPQAGHLECRGWMGSWWLV